MVLQLAPSWLQLTHGEQISSEVTYHVCPTCGFRLMEMAPPTVQTYPFPVETCFVCGYRRDSDGIFAGKSLDRESKLEAVRMWLLRYDLNEDVLQRHYHLSLTAFFADGSL